MIARLIRQESGRRTFELLFGRGEEITGQLQEFLKKKKLLASTFRARGGVENLTVGCLDHAGKSMRRNSFKGVLEVLALEGEVIIRNGSAEIDARVVAGRPDGTVCGGKLLEASSADLEMVLTEVPRFPRTANHHPLPDSFYHRTLFEYSPGTSDFQRRIA